MECILECLLAIQVELKIACREETKGCKEELKAGSEEMKVTINSIRSELEETNTNRV
jgi:hypothetical protein